MIVKINPEKIIYEKRIQNLCLIPYYGHPKGCMNYGKKKGCPPNQPLINDVLDFSKNVYVIYTEFPVGEFAEKIKEKHKEWGNRQIYNPRFWQGKARKIQRNEEARAIKEFDVEKIIRCPEAHGVNITELMKQIGINLAWTGLRLIGKIIKLILFLLPGLLRYKNLFFL